MDRKSLLTAILSAPEETTIDENFAWDGDELIVRSEAAAKKIRRSRLSASTMKSITKCAARWAFESVAPRIDEPFAATTLGTEMHGMYEVFYDTSKVPVWARTPELLERMIAYRADQLWGPQTLAIEGEDGKPVEPSAVELRALENNKKKWTKEITSRVMGIFKIENPQDIVVLRAHMRADGSISHAEDPEATYIHGIEFSADDIQVSGIDLIAYIDRISVDGYDDDGNPYLVPEDYKSSKRVPWIKRGDTDDDGDQINLYAEAIRIKFGFLPEKGRLLYTKVGKPREIEITERSVNRTVRRFVKANKIMDSTCSEGAFPADKTTFCGWCPLVDTCPTAAKNGTSRAPTNTNEVNLGIPTLRVKGEDAPVNAAGEELPTIPAKGVVAVTRTWDDMQEAAKNPSAKSGKPNPEAGLHAAYAAIALEMTGERGMKEIESITVLSEPDGVVVAEIIDEVVPSDETETATELVVVGAEEVAPTKTPAKSKKAPAKTGKPKTPPTRVTGAGDSRGGSSTGSSKSLSPTMMESEESARADKEGGTAMSKALMSARDKVPYEEFLADGSLNPNSYASMASFGLGALALETLVKEYGGNITRGQIMSLSATFAKVLNRSFESITGENDSNTNISIWQSGVSTRIRGALRTVLSTYDDIPLMGGTDELWWDWVEKTVSRITVIATVAVETWETSHSEIDEEPTWDALLPAEDAPAKKTKTRK